MRKYSSVPFSKVTVTGQFWHERLETVLTKTIPSQYRQLDAYNMLRSLKLPRPVPPLTIPRKGGDQFTTEIFWDSDIGKWIEAAAYALSHRRDASLEGLVDDMVADLEKAQAADGYLNCWYLLREPEKRWTNLRDNHELYNAGHLLEGAVAYYQSTGKAQFLQVMERYIDHIATEFGSKAGQRRAYPGHQEIELALIRAFHATGKQKYLDLARYFIDERGAKPHYFDIERDARKEPANAYWHKTYEYSQAHLPVREQTKVVGHAVRAFYMYTAMADLAAELGDESLKSTCETLWRDVVDTRMYITGGFGSSASNEGFTSDYDLPNDTAYAETCASVAMVFWAARMLNLDLDGQYADILERALYNNTLAGLSHEGEHYFYDNKLESDGTHQRWEWHPCPCCTMNVARLIASVGSYFVGVGENEIALHLYGGMETELALAGGSVKLTETSNYPWDGEISIMIEPTQTQTFTLALRIPAWVDRDAVIAQVNNAAVDMTVVRGYLKISRAWQAGDHVTLNLPMPVQRIYAHPLVKNNAGCVALQRGPLVYCFEQQDQAQLLKLSLLPADAPITAQFDTALLGGATKLIAQGAYQPLHTWGNKLYDTQSSKPALTEPCCLTAIPYYLWCNRGSNAMQVWIKE